MNQPALTPQHQALVAEGESALQKYKRLAVGKDASALHFVLYEVLTTLFSSLPGLLGFGLRSALYPSMFARCGKRPAIGRGVLIRNPARITLGNNVMIDDYAVLDVRGEAGSIEIGDYVSIGRYSMIVAKDGKVSIASGANIGSFCRVATQSSVRIGESVLVAAYAYIGPGNHQEGDEDAPLVSKAMDIKGGVSIEKHAWIGARATVMDGVTVGERAVVAAHAFVKDAVPVGATVGGIPARILKD